MNPINEAAEREAFEAHIRNESDTEEYATLSLQKTVNGFYCTTRIQGAWEGWQARATQRAEPTLEERHAEGVAKLMASADAAMVPSVTPWEERMEQYYAQGGKAICHPTSYFMKKELNDWRASVATIKDGK